MFIFNSTILHDFNILFDNKKKSLVHFIPPYFFWCGFFLVSLQRQLFFLVCGFLLHVLSACWTLNKLIYFSREGERRRFNENRFNSIFVSEFNQKNWKFNLFLTFFCEFLKNIEIELLIDDKHQKNTHLKWDKKQLIYGEKFKCLSWTPAVESSTIILLIRKA